MTVPSLPRILVVDDEAVLATAIRETLSQHGYQVQTAATPAAALAHLARERFDLLLTDLHLPEGDGVSLLRAAQEIDPHMVGIMMTGQGSIDSAVAAMKAGAHDYILKPFKLSVALAVLARALATRHLRRDNEQLQERLRRRTAELEATNRELEAFSYSVSHDLRAPLRSIEGFAAILQEELGANQNETVGDCLRRIGRATDRMGRLIEDLLRLGQAIRTPLQNGPVDLTALAREIAAKLQAEDPARAVTWNIGPTPPAFGDPGLLQIVLTNLLSNAWKYTRRVPAPEITFGGETLADGTAAYMVRDNGAGFDMAMASRLFVPFQRLHPESEFEGTGIGLATVQRIVRRHGGMIGAEAAPGQGATFRFTLGA